uniref:PSP1 C-terminal domain-containing protein n=1 Tax=Entomoneis paludosa TaxID=265537 RepID=A0A7S2YPJ5_9STRA|mmetsp:Transcript_41080/g.85530  ORF Transcript_41080/g.85530 Transcript_41080/m.85530 type:complete len:795 (+) Transcript_41080:721-3105(+)
MIFATYNSSDSRLDTKPLEIGMTGMSLVAGHNEQAPTRKETGSTISSTPPDEDVNVSSRTGTRSRNNSSDLHPPPSPSNNSDNNSNAPRSSGMRPPGMAPSPISKPGHAKNPSGITTATSPLLSLTPNSSVDGNSEWTSRQPSPPGEAPAIPFLTNDQRRVSSADHHSGDVGSIGSYEHQERENDGLLGLGALGERAHAGGNSQYSSSPPVARGYLPSHELERRRDRPPLSQSYNDGGSSHGDRSVGERSTGSGGYQMSQGNGFDAVDTRGFGAIARPELRQSASEFDPSVRSTGSTDSGHAFSLPSNGGVFEPGHLSQKFGSLPSLGSHMQQQRGFMSNEMVKPRHLRSVSQPTQNPPATVQMNPHMYNQQQLGMAQRSASVASYNMSGSYEGHYGNAKRNSLPAFSSSPNSYGQMHPNLERRDALDFQGGHPGVMPDEVRGLGGPSMISPGQSPHQIHYAHSGGGHSRQPSDSSNPMLSSSPMSMSNNMMRNQHGIPLRQNSMGDEDLHHPLVGEHIEVPEQHYQDPQFLLGAQGAGGSVPMLRAGGHGHSVSMGELPSHYIDSGNHHLPTAGAALPLPKVVYNVKFKRTQRNFVLGPRITRDLKIGTYVKVEADRGEDLGIVIGKVPADKFNFASRTQYTAGMGPPGGMGGSSAADLKRIIRLATHDEVSLLGVKRDEEEELLKICRGKVRQRGLPMNVVDAEYQFDRHKLTFFFEAEGRVDFRELVRDLFSMYKTRIWMQQLDKNTATSSPAIMAPQQHLQMDYGTPIIAPPSEFADSLPMAGMGDARTY